MYCQQATSAPQQNPFLCGDLMPEGTEGEYNVSTGQKLIYMTDQLKSVRDVIDGTSGSLVQSYDYTPYGAVARSNGSTPTDYQYAGLFAHAQSGLNLAKHRAMDGVTGRFINRDPIKERGGLNLYAYVGANPINALDPSGLCAKPDKKAQCQALLADILRKYASLAKELAKYDPNTDWMGGFPMRWGSGRTKPGGHFREIGNLQRGIRNDMQIYYNLRCDEDDSQGGGGTGPIPINIFDDATKPVQPPNYPTPQPGTPFNLPAPEGGGIPIPEPFGGGGVPIFE